MGYTVYSGVAVGYLIPKEDVIKKTKKHACGHKTDETKKFCSDCGKPVWKEATTEVLSDECKYDDFEVIRYGSGDSPEFGAGIITRLKNATYDGNDSTLALSKLPTDLKQYAVDLKESLKKYGVEVDINNFGVHAVVYHSY